VRDEPNQWLQRIVNGYAIDDPLKTLIRLPWDVLIVASKVSIVRADRKGSVSFLECVPVGPQALNAALAH
jgi:hypothetical protein